MTNEERLDAYEKAAMLCAREVASYYMRADVNRGQPTLCAIVSDTFSYACADAEDIPLADIATVYGLWQEYGYDGIIKYVWDKRGTPPLPEIRAKMPSILLSPRVPAIALARHL